MTGVQTCALPISNPLPTTLSSFAQRICIPISRPSSVAISPTMESPPPTCITIHLAPAPGGKFAACAVHCTRRNPGPPLPGPGSGSEKADRPEKYLDRVRSNGITTYSISMRQAAGLRPARSSSRALSMIAKKIQVGLRRARSSISVRVSSSEVSENGC